MGIFHRSSWSAYRWPGYQFPHQFIPKMFYQVEFSPVQFFHTRLCHPCLRGAWSKLLAQSWEHGLLQNVLVCWSSQSSCHSTRFYTWHNAVRRGLFCWTSPPTQTRPSDRQVEKRDLSIQRPRLHCVLYTSASDALVIFGSIAAAPPWKPVPWSSLRTELIWKPHEVRRSVAIDPWA